MIAQTKHQRPLSLFLTIASLFLILSCSFSPNKQSQSIVAEEAYINLKYGFSLVIPSTWVRVQIPVSSPLYRQNTIKWKIPVSKENSGTLQVSIGPKSTLPPREQLAVFSKELSAEALKNSKDIDLPAGKATRWEEQDQHSISIAIEGVDRIYYITSNFSGVEYKRLLPYIEKVFISFSILPNSES